MLLTLIVITVLSLMITPLLSYGWSVSRQRSVVDAKNERVEAVKGALRLALADPAKLYAVCADVAPSAPVALAMPTLAVPVGATCAQVGNRLAALADRYQSVATAVGGTLPAIAARQYTTGSAAATAWIAHTTSSEADNKIWLPNLPAPEMASRSANGWEMPGSYAGCRVYFPGTYTSAVTIAANAKVYFASGVYSFTQPVTIGAGAQVVVGSGAQAGCATDQEAWFDAINPPATHGITGGGAQFVFGGAGQVVVNATSGSTSVVFNQRYAATGKVGQEYTTGLSIVSVNGEMIGGSYSDTTRAGLLSVPKSLITGTTPPQPATSQPYTPSTLVPANAAALATVTPIVDLNLGTAPATLVFRAAGYVSVPQGRIEVSTAAGGGAGSDVSFGGGLLAATTTVSGPAPASFVIALQNPVVQRTFRIVTTTTTGSPTVTSDAVVFVNQNGNAAVKLWTIS